MRNQFLMYPGLSRVHALLTGIASSSRALTYSTFPKLNQALPIRHFSNVDAFSSIKVLNVSIRLPCEGRSGNEGAE